MRSLERAGRAVARGVVRAPVAVLLTLAVLTGTGAALGERVGFAADPEAWLDPDDPALETYHRFLDTFGVDETLVLGLFELDVFAPETLERIRTLEAELAAVPGVGEARSLASARSIGAEGALVAPLLPAAPVDAEAARAARARWAADPLLRAFASDDAVSTAVVLALDRGTEAVEAKARVVQEVRGIAQAAFPRAEIAVAGTPAVAEAILRHGRTDLLTVGVAGLLLVLALGGLAFRSWSFAFGPALVIAPSLLLLVGAMGLAGEDFTLVTQALLTLLIASGTADAVHVLSAYRSALERGASREPALVEAAGQTFAPCLFTTLTTAAGMLALTQSGLEPVRDLGRFGALGVALAFIFAFTALPALFALLPRPRRLGSGDRIGRLLARGAALGRTRPRLVLGLAAIAAGLSGVGLAAVEVGAEPLAYFRADDPVRAGTERIDRALHGSTSIELSVSATEGGPFLDASRAAALERLATWMERLPAVTQVEGVHGPLAALGHALTGTRAVPSTDAGLEQALLLLEAEPSLTRVLSVDRDHARLSARVRMSETKALLRALPEIERRLAELAERDELRVEPTGYVKLVSEMEARVVESQSQSFLFAFALVSGLLLVLLGPRLGLLALLPNLVPVLFGLGFMGAAGMPLDPGTAMVASLTLGLVVDDTVHLLSGLRDARRAGLALGPALDATLERVGRALLVTSLLLVAGFGALGLGRFRPNVALGAVASVVITSALVCDIVVLPALLRLFPRAFAKTSREA